MNTTRDDVRKAHYRFCNTAQWLLKEGETFILQEGSPSNGRAWRIYVMRPGSSAYYQPPAGISDYIGWTKEEAAHTLHTLATGIEAERSRGLR